MSYARQDRSLIAPIGRSLLVSFECGAHMVEAQKGHTTGRLAAGGLIVWAVCLAVILLGANATPAATRVLHCLARHCLG